ncbi:hypothetical protein ACSBOB_01500 [Mesorhizobium sp. ASY16-5R]|uniref:hypothetical protein n=1 Tax=Mesorhizobium sp. ASY16-5R TaxID=3445772 RepID=UPI003FA1196D
MSNKLKIVSGSATIDPTGEGASVLGEVTIKATTAVAITFIQSECLISLGDKQLGGGAFEPTINEPIALNAGEEYTIKIGGGVGSEDADKNAVSFKVTIQVRYGGGPDDEDFLTMHGQSAGAGEVETVELTAGD